MIELINNKSIAFIYKREKAIFKNLFSIYLKNKGFSLYELTDENCDKFEPKIPSKEKECFLIKIPHFKDEYDFGSIDYRNNVFVEYIFYINKKNELVEIKNRHSNRRIIQEDEFLDKTSKEILQINSISDLDNLTKKELDDKIELLKLNFGV